MNRTLDTRIMGWYELTISPPPSFRKKTELHIELSTKIERFLRRVSKAYAIFPELQFMTARLHYHCVLRLDDKTAWLKGLNSIQKIGFIHSKQLKTYKDKLRWIVYCHKEAPLTREVLSPLPVPIIPNKKRVKRERWNAVCKTNHLIADLTRREKDDDIRGIFTIDMS